MTTILVGQDTSDRGYYVPTNLVWLETEYPCDGNGIISTVSFRTALAGNFKAGIFRPLNSGIVQCVALHDFGALNVGVHSFTDLSLVCASGDYLGLVCSGGRLNGQVSGGGGAALLRDLGCYAGGFYNTEPNAAYEISLGGSGVTVAAEPNGAEIYAVLEEVRTDYLPAVQAWMRDNISYLSAKDYEFALAVWQSANLGSGGVPFTGPTLQQIKEILGTPYETTLADQHTAILTSFSDQHTAQNLVLDAIAEDVGDPAGALAIAETNILNAISVTEGRLGGNPIVGNDDLLTAIEAVSVPEGVALTTDVTAAVGTLTGEIGEAVTDVNAHTDAALALLDFAQAADITAAHATTDGKIDALNNVSEVAIGALVDAAVGTLTGEVDEAVGVLSGLISAIDPDTDTRYPGYELTSRGTTVRVTSQGTVSATTHGVGGKMEGVLLSMVSVPPRCTERVIQGHSNYRYPGWIVFADSQGNCDEPQWCNMDDRVYAPKGIKEPAFCICGFAEGVVADVTPWIVT